MSRRSLYLEGTFSESNGRRVNPGTVIRNRNPNPPAPTINPKDFDKYINILKANNKYPIPQELTLALYTTPYTLDKDVFFAKDSVITYHGTSPAYINYFNLSNNSDMRKINEIFQYTETGFTTVTQSTDTDWTFIYIEDFSNYYRITYTVHRAAGQFTYTIPSNCYYYTSTGNYDTEGTPTLNFFEGDSTPILSLCAVSTPTDDETTQVLTSSLITRFVLPSTS